MAKSDPPRWTRHEQARWRVLVSVADELIRCGVSQLLSELPVVASVAESPAPEATSTLLAETEYDVVIVSADGAIDVTGAIVRTAARRETSSLLLLRQVEDALEPEVSGLPVDGFLLESGLSRSVLAEALQKLGRGDMPIPSTLARRIFDELHSSARGRPDTLFMLTPRERQALGLLAEGLSNKQIARRLEISEHGAKRHVSNVLAKLNCPNRTVAVTVALNHGLLGEQQPELSAESAVVDLRRRMVARPARGGNQRRDGSIG